MAAVAKAHAPSVDAMPRAASQPHRDAVRAMRTPAPATRVRARARVVRAAAVPTAGRLRHVGARHRLRHRTQPQTHVVALSRVGPAVAIAAPDSTSAAAVGGVILRALLAIGIGLLAFALLPLPVRVADQFSRVLRTTTSDDARMRIATAGVAALASTLVLWLVTHL